jgi:hypothetical protein
MYQKKSGNPAGIDEYVLKLDIKCIPGFSNEVVIAQ